MAFSIVSLGKSRFFPDDSCSDKDLLMFNKTAKIIAPTAGSTATQGQITLQPKSSHLSNQSESTKAAVWHKLAESREMVSNAEKTKTIIDDVSLSI